MDASGDRGEGADLPLEELGSASPFEPTPFDDAARDPADREPEPALRAPAQPPARGASEEVALAKPPAVSAGARVALLLAMLVFSVGLLIPAVLLGWAGANLLVSGTAGTALLETGGLEPRTFGPALMIGLSIAALLLMMVAVGPAAERGGRVLPGRVHALGRPSSGRRRVLRMMLWLTAVACATSLAAAMRSPFFPYPLATISVVAAVAFFAVVSLATTYGVLHVGLRGLYRWACTAEYRAGVVTASCLLLGLIGLWIAKQGWTARPLRVVADELELARLDAPDSVTEAGEMVFCLGAGELRPDKARSSAAPACSLPTRITSRDDCFEALMRGPAYQRTVKMLRSRYRVADPENVATDALLKTCMREPLPENAPAYLTGVAGKMALRRHEREKRDLAGAVQPQGPCDVACAVERCQLTAAVMQQLKPRELAVAERYLQGWKHAEIDRALGWDAGDAKNVWGYAMARVGRELRSACQIE